MTLPLSFYAIAAIAVLITGLSKSGFGGGLGVMAVPLMSLFVAPQFAVAILMPILLVMDVIIVWRYRRQCDRRVYLMLMPGAVFGLAVGALTFQWMNADVIKLMIGVLAIGFAAQYAVSRRQSVTGKQTKRPVVFGMGALSGFASFVAHAGGPPVKGFLLRQGFEKSVFVGTNTFFFFSLNALKAIAFTLMGQLSAESLLLSLLISPMLFAGIFLGLKLHGLVSQAVFVKIVYGFLSLTGLKLVWDSAAVFLA